MAKKATEKKADKKNGATKQGAWPADRIKRLRTEDLVPYARNARMHTNSQIDQLSNAIKKFGFTNPVIVAENGEIIAGHGRVMAARRLGLSEVPGIVIVDGEW